MIENSLQLCNFSEKSLKARAKSMKSIGGFMRLNYKERRSNVDGSIFREKYLNSRLKNDR